MLTVIGHGCPQARTQGRTCTKRDDGETALKLLEHFIQRGWNRQVCHTDDHDPAVMSGAPNASS